MENPQISDLHKLRQIPQILRAPQPDITLTIDNPIQGFQDLIDQPPRKTFINLKLFALPLQNPPILPSLIPDEFLGP